MKPNWTRRRFVGVGPGVAATSLAASRSVSAGELGREALATADRGVPTRPPPHLLQRRPPLPCQEDRSAGEPLSAAAARSTKFWDRSGNRWSWGWATATCISTTARSGEWWDRRSKPGNTSSDWRIMCMVRDARKLGTDQLREVILRGRKERLPVLPSLKLQDGNRPAPSAAGGSSGNGESRSASGRRTRAIPDSSTATTKGTPPPHHRDVSSPGTVPSGLREPPASISATCAGPWTERSIRSSGRWPIRRRTNERTSGTFSSRWKEPEPSPVHRRNGCCRSH